PNNPAACHSSRRSISSATCSGTTACRWALIHCRRQASCSPGYRFRRPPASNPPFTTGVLMRTLCHALQIIALGACSLATIPATQAQPVAAQADAAQWPTYGGNLASHRYAPLDQINKDNFGQLQLAWRLNTNFLGPRPDTLYSATPLYANGMLYTDRKSVV